MAQELLGIDVPGFTKCPPSELKLKKESHGGIAFLTKNSNDIETLINRINDGLSSPDRVDKEIWRLCIVPISRDYTIWRYCSEYYAKLSSDDIVELKIVGNPDGLRPNQYSGVIYQAIVDSIDWSDEASVEFANQYVMICSIEAASPAHGYMNANVGIFGGSVQRNENVEECAWREFREESRIDLHCDLSTFDFRKYVPEIKRLHAYIDLMQPQLRSRFNCPTLPLYNSISGTLECKRRVKDHWMKAKIIILPENVKCSSLV